jgi:hypothetical protein
MNDARGGDDTSTNRLDAEVWAWERMDSESRETWWECGVEHDETAENPGGLRPWWSVEAQTGATSYEVRVSRRGLGRSWSNPDFLSLYHVERLSLPCGSSVVRDSEGTEG